MFKFFRLTFLRSIERFLAQWILVSTEPSAFFRERIHLGNTTNFLRATNFFISAISTALLAEVATLHLLGIGDLNEPYYWLFILLTSIPFVLICFLVARLVAPFSFRDVLHLSFYPIGAGVFTGAAFALVVSAVVALLVAVGFIPEIKFDLSQWKALQAAVDPFQDGIPAEVVVRLQPALVQPDAAFGLQPDPAAQRPFRDLRDSGSAPADPESCDGEKKRAAPSAARGRLWEKGGAGGRHGPYVGTRARPWL